MSLKEVEVERRVRGEAVAREERRRGEIKVEKCMVEIDGCCLFGNFVVSFVGFGFVVVFGW